jgi:predicted NBD/HSP70 family sugar kinase
MTEAGRPGSIRRTNRRLILDCLREGGDVSVARLSEISKLSKTTIMKILAQYQAQGLVVNIGKGSSTLEGGKPPALFRFNEKAGVSLVYHVFPDELYSVVTDLGNTILAERSQPVSGESGAGETVDKMAELYQEHTKGVPGLPEKLIGIAIGAHGITDIRRGVVITSPHFPRWGDNLPLGRMLQSKVPFHGPVVVDNQIRFQVYAEKTLGVARNRKNIIALDAGAGLVAGIIVKDEIKRGVHNLAGEVGHMVMSPEDDEVCACGGRGCFEVMVSTKRILRCVRERSGLFPDSELFNDRKPEQVTVRDVFRAAEGGDPLAGSVMDETARWFAIGLSNLGLAYDPEIIVIQGVFTAAGDSFLERLRQYINQVSLLKIRRSIEIVYSRFGKNAGVLGASALLASEYLAKQVRASGAVSQR